MEYLVYFDICAIVIIVTELMMFYMKKNVINLHNRFFSVIMWLALGTSICDLLIGLYNNGLIDINENMFMILTYGFLVFCCAIPALFLLYILSIIERIYSIFKTCAGVIISIPTITLYFVIAMNPYFSWAFEINGDKVSVGFAAVVLVYFQLAFYFIASVFFIHSYSRVLNHYRKMCLYIFMFLTICGVGTQFMYPKMTIASFGLALSMMVLYLGVQSPEEILDKELGIFNKTMFVQKANIYFKSKNPFQIVSITIDEWKFLEKTFGVTVLQEFLERFVQDIKEEVVSYNTEMYRIDESSFYLFMYGNKKNAEELAKKVLEVCNKDWVCGYVEIPVAVDICVIKCPEDFEKVDDILQCTEYLSKEEHEPGNRIVYAKDASSGYGKRRNDIRKAIHRAIKNESFKVYYQPIYSTKTDSILSAEALVRLIDEDMGFIPPDEFIPIAESDGSIVKIGNFVLESVCKFMMENDLHEKGIEFIEINVSMVECMKRDMVDRVEGIMKKYGLRPSQINLEVTETAATNSADMLNCNMQNLVEKGIAFSLDDYGSGYSNINYIINLPFHLIKMDKNIVWSAFTNKKAGTVLESSVSMIQKLDLKIVAEGVETKEQMERLKEMGCEYLQGYYFSKPLPGNEFLEYIEKRA